MASIEHPNEKTYYIIVDENNNHLENGSIEPTQCLYSGKTIIPFTDYEQYKTELLTYNIELE